MNLPYRNGRQGSAACIAGAVTRWWLTVLSNVVAYGCGPSSTGIGMTLINIGASATATATSSAACTTRAAGNRMRCGKGKKVGNPLAGPCPYSGTKELPVVAARTCARLFHSAGVEGRSGDRRAAKPVAGIAEIGTSPKGCSPYSSRRRGSGNCGNPRRGITPALSQ